MKNRLLIICLVLVTLWIGFLMFAPKQTLRPSANQNPENSSEPVGLSTTAERITELPVPIAETNSAIPPTNREPSLEEKIRSAIAYANVPIAFYGKVVDQDDKPLSAVRVVLRTRKGVYAGPGLLSTGSEKFTRMTGEDGGFNLSGTKGDVLAVESIEKEGYELSTKTSRSFGFHGAGDKFVPDPNNPVVYRMWRIRGGEPMTYFPSANFGIACDGTPTLFDLLKGVRANGQADLKVSFVRTPLNIERNKDFRYDWVLTIEASDGGLIESEDEFMYVAPEKGYLPQIQYKMGKDEENWTAIIKKKFYIVSRGGRCVGRFNLHFDGGYEPPPTGFGIEAWMNPAGSRNLEYDPMKPAILK